MEEKNLTGYPSIDKPWLKYYSEEAINAPLPECTMYEYIWKRNQDNLDRTAINYYGTNMSYGKFFETVSEVASALENIGVKAGDMVTVCMINSPETVCLTFALNKIGATANMVYGASTPEEIKTQVNNVHSRVVFTLNLFQSKFEEIIDQTEIETVVIGTMTQSMSIGMKIGARLFKGMKQIPLPSDKRFVSWKNFLRHANGNSSMCHDPNAVAIITYTGGTTGGSKGVLLSNKAVIAVAQQYIDGESCLKRESTWAQVLPLFIAYGVTCSMLIPMAVGMTLIVRIPMSESIADICKKFKPNHIMYGPAYWEAFADSEQDIDVSYLLAPISGGDTLHGVTEDKINTYLKEHGSGYPIMNGYGMTEVGAAVSVNMTGAYRARTVGIPFAHNIISAFDVDTGKELPYGVDGEICIHTPSAMLGYVNQPEETANIMREHEDGLVWVHTGDLGHIDEDGFVYISGRLKRFMLHISDGLQKKIFSLDIERVLLQHPAVKNCVVVPIDDAVHNQVPVAFILPKKDATPNDELLADINRFCEENIDQYHQPVKYYYLEKVPLTKIGKVDYRALEKEAEEEMVMPEYTLNPDEFDVEIFEKAKNNPNKAQGGEPLYSTAALPDLGIHSDDIPVPDYEDIRNNKTAYLLFLHKVKEQGEAYQNAMRTAAKAKRKIEELEKKAEDRKSAVIIMTAAEIVLSIGISGLFTGYAAIFCWIVAAGILMTALSLYLNFKK